MNKIIVITLIVTAVSLIVIAAAFMAAQHSSDTCPAEEIETCKEICKAKGYQYRSCITGDKDYCRCFTWTWHGIPIGKGSAAGTATAVLIIAVILFGCGFRFYRLKNVQVVNRPTGNVQT